MSLRTTWLRRKVSRFQRLENGSNQTPNSWETAEKSNLSAQTSPGWSDLVWFSQLELTWFGSGNSNQTRSRSKNMAGGVDLIKFGRARWWLGVVEVLISRSGWCSGEGWRFDCRCDLGLEVGEEIEFDSNSHSRFNWDGAEGPRWRSLDNCCAPITTRRGIPESPKHEEQILKTAQIPKSEKEHTKNND